MRGNHKLQRGEELPENGGAPAKGKLPFENGGRLKLRKRTVPDSFQPIT